MVSIWLRGLGIGLAIAAPVGPIGVLVIKRALVQGWRSGLVSGLGAASADACYGAVAALGLTALSRWLLSWQGWLRWIGGLYLLWLAWRTWRTATAEQAAVPDTRSLLRAYSSTFGLTLTNPATIVSFGAIFASISVGSAPQSAWVLVVGVFCGSALWWLLLSGSMAATRAWIGPQHWRWINRGAALALAGLSLLIIAAR